VPAAAYSALRAISSVAACCCSTAAEIAVAMPLMSRIV
jgi:hypothetical protein